MANKLKKLIMTSVDFVRRGANQDADIKLFKSADGFESAMKSQSEITDMIKRAERLAQEYAEALVESIYSVLHDNSMDESEAREFMEKSLSEFDEAVKSDIISGFTYTAEKPKKTKKSIENESEETNMADFNVKLIDKSLLSAAESEQLESLLAKACKKETAKAEPEKEPEKDLEGDPVVPPKKEEKTVVKSAEVPTAVQAMLDRMESLAKSVELNKFVEVAKKYEALGEDTDKLAKSLYDMKQVGDDAYNSYVAALDKSINVLEKSGMFGEIGKSAYGKDTTGLKGNVSKSEVESKIETIAKGFMEKDASMTVAMATAKAWEANPDLAVEYENSRM